MTSRDLSNNETFVVIGASVNLTFVLGTLRDGRWRQYWFTFVFPLSREWNSYFRDPYNYFDWLGLVLMFLVIPLRFAEVQSQWSVAGLGYLFNFLRLFKFSCVTRYYIFLRISTRVKRLMLRPHIIPLEESVQTIRLRLFTRGKIKIIH